MRRCGQAAFEFIILTGFMLVVFSLFFLVIQGSSAQQQQRARQQEFAAVADIVEKEVLLAHQVRSGYQRTFELPLLVDEEAYAIDLYPPEGPSELVVRSTGTSNFEYVIFLSVNLSPGSALQPGYNEIVKTDENITINAYVPPKQCSGSCDDSNPCTSDVCVDGECKNPGFSEGTVCSLAGTGTEECHSKTCAECDADHDGAKGNIQCAVHPDCDDNNPAVRPGATENCMTAYDDNCNGQANEGCPANSVRIWSACFGNSTYEDLHANASSAISGVRSTAYDWRVSGSSLAVLQLTFDTNNSAGPALTRDYSFRNITATVRNGPIWNAASGVAGSGAYSFDGANDYVDIADNSFLSVRDNFTISLWASPTATRPSTPQAGTGISGTSSQRYAIYPQHGGVAGLAGVGVSVGTNGVSVFEHTAGYLPSPLVHDTPVSGWTHIAVVYTNRMPSLYFNGVFVKNGVMGSQATVYPGQDVGGIGNPYGNFSGMLDDVRIYNRSLSAEEISLLSRNMGNTTSHQETGVGESWSVCATASNGSQDGATICSVALSVTSANSACACTAVAPVNVRNMSVTASNATLAWTPGTGGFMQKIRIGPNENDVKTGCPGFPGASTCVRAEDLPATNSTYFVNGLAAGVRYFARVVTYRDPGCFKDAITNFTTLACVPGTACSSPQGGTYDATCTCRCAANQCRVTNVSGSYCFNNNAANPQNGCQYCNTVAPTQWTNRPNFYACSDGMFCTENDYCWGGACSQNTGSPCSGSIPSCDETTNQCEQCLTGSDCQTNFPDTPYCINNACYECVWNGDCVPQAPYCYSMWGGGFDNYYYSLGTNGVCQSHSCKYSSVTCGYRHGSEPLSAWCDDPSMGRPATGDGCCTASGTGGTLVCPF